MRYAVPPYASLVQKFVKIGPRIFFLVHTRPRVRAERGPRMNSGQYPPQKRVPTYVGMDESFTAPGTKC